MITDTTLCIWLYEPWKTAAKNCSENEMYIVDIGLDILQIYVEKYSVLIDSLLKWNVHNNIKRNTYTWTCFSSEKKKSSHLLIFPISPFLEKENNI
jgi:hypothetical protein